MNLKLILYGFQFFIVFLTSLQLQAQNSITYNGNNLNPEERLITITDTQQHKLVLSFSPSDRSPYWNLPLPEIIDTDKGSSNKSKRFDLQAVNAISRNEIPGLVALDGGSIILNPDWATTGFLCYTTTNNQWLLIYSSIYFYNNDEEWLGYAMNIDIYSAQGKLYRSMSSTDGEMSEAKLTTDGSYLIYGNLNVDSYILGSRNFGYRIIDLKSMRKIIEYNDKDLNLISLYCKVFDNYICIMLEPLNDQIEGPIQSDGQLIFLDMINKIKYTGPVEHDLKYNLKGIAEKGILFGIKDAQDSQTILKDFNDFQKERLR
jgi:hypothetical protein